MDSITTQQLAALADCDPSWLIKRRGALPPAAPAHTGANGRPPLCWSLADIAEFVATHTSHLSDAECRVRVALSHLSPERQA